MGKPIKKSKGSVLVYYPYTFKKFFFQCMRQQGRKKAVRRLPFWAPPSIDGKAKTQNKKIEEISKRPRLKRTPE